MEHQRGSTLTGLTFLSQRLLALPPGIQSFLFLSYSRLPFFSSVAVYGVRSNIFCMYTLYTLYTIMEKVRSR